DRNFRIATDDGAGFVLKVANPGEDHSIAEMQVAALQHIAAVDPELPVPRVRKTLAGESLGSMRGPDGRTYSVGMVTFLDGVTVEAVDLELPAIREVGTCAARLGHALRGFWHPSAGRSLVWDLKNAASLVPTLDDVDDPLKRGLAAGALERFDKK